jgi:hypothetical protein
MGQVVRLATLFRRNPGRRQSAEPLAASVYYCRRCEADRFLLYPDGKVQCAGCGAKIENLGVSASRSE